MWSPGLWGANGETGPEWPVFVLSGSFRRSFNTLIPSEIGKGNLGGAIKDAYSRQRETQ
jgi:hypothetical protein